MNRISLAIVCGPHQPSLAAGHHITATRIATKISFGIGADWSGFELAIVDTGAPLSLFPKAIWTKIDRQVLATVSVGGLTQKPECRFAADLAVIRCMLSDGVNLIGPFRMNALLARNDTVPALLRLAGVLDEASPSVALRNDSANLEMS